MKKIMYCKNCKKYTLLANCPICNEKTLENKPPKYSPEDPYGKYRRKAKSQE